jgi:hypothetical protein
MRAHARVVRPVHARVVRPVPEQGHAPTLDLRPHQDRRQGRARPRTEVRGV